MTYIILAAGKGTRMHSDKPKVLQKILGSPMLACVYRALQPVFGSDILTLVGHRADLVGQVRSSDPRTGSLFGLLLDVGNQAGPGVDGGPREP